MKVHRLYTGADGESHFEDVDVEFVQETPAGRLSARLPASGVVFREVVGDYERGWGPAPRRQYVVNLDAGVEITASDGERRLIPAGDVLLIEDTWGKGHLSRAVTSGTRRCMYVTVD